MLTLLHEGHIVNLKYGLEILMFQTLLELSQHYLLEDCCGDLSDVLEVRVLPRAHQRRHLAAARA